MPTSSHSISATVAAAVAKEAGRQAGRYAGEGDKKTGELSQDQFSPDADVEGKGRKTITESKC